MSLFTVTRHTSYYVGTKADGSPIFRTSSHFSKFKPKIYTKFSAAQKVANSLCHWPDSGGRRPRVSKVLTHNRVLA